MPETKHAKTDRLTSKAKALPQVTEYKSLAIKDLIIERFQVRKQNLSEGLDELAASIERYGLLQPIVVCKSSTHFDKWEIICGQRRYLAHKQVLHRQYIMAGIIDQEITTEDGMAISANENVLRVDMTKKDMIDFCLEMYRRYKSVKDVAEETKIPYHIVRQYIRYDALPEELKEQVRNKTINTDLAVKIQDAASAAGRFSPQEAVKLIKLLNSVDNAMQTKIIELRKKNPTVPLEKIAKKAEEPDETLRLSLVLGESIARPLRRYAQEEDMDERSAVEGFIKTSLKGAGYLDDNQ